MISVILAVSLMTSCAGKTGSGDTKGNVALSLGNMSADGYRLNVSEDTFTEGTTVEVTAVADISEYRDEV